MFKVYVLIAGIFNFSAISCTKELTSTTRVVFANLRTIFVWLISLTLKWESFYFLQLIGFLILLAGTYVYNDQFKGIKRILNLNKSTEDESKHLLDN